MQIFTTLSEPLIYLLAFGIIFAETGVVACFFFPGDTLLFSLGLLAHQGMVDLPILIVVLVVAAFSGNMLGYWFGYLVREKRESSKVLKKVPERHIERTERFYVLYGTWTVVFSRFIPIVRSVAPFLAGVSRMNHRRFTLLSLIGAIAWAVVVPSIGYVFGSYIPLEAIGFVSIGLMVLASVLTPVVVAVSHNYFKKG